MSTQGGAKSIAEALVASLRKMEQPAFLQAGGDLSHELGWWVSPDESEPRYGVAKWKVTLTADDHLWVGLVWEKGLDGGAARGYIAPVALLMDRPWAFSRLVQASKEPGFLDELAFMAMARPLIVQLKLTNGLVPGFQPHRSPYKHIMEWEYQDGMLTLVHPVYEQGPLAELARSAHLSDIFEAIGRLPEERWLWAMITVGWRYEAPDKPSIATRQWEQWWPLIQRLVPSYALERG